MRSEQYEIFYFKKQQLWKQKKTNKCSGNHWYLMNWKKFQTKKCLKDIIYGYLMQATCICAVNLFSKQDIKKKNILRTSRQPSLLSYSFEILGVKIV